MALINFENSPSTTTPINAENLNNNFNLMHPVGSIHITSTNENPSDKLGGEWKLIDKQFAWWVTHFDNDSTNSAFIPSENLSSYLIYLVRTGHTLRIRLEMTPAIDLNDSVYNLGAFELEKLGVSTFSNSILQILSGTDAGNGIVSLAIGHTGNVETRDIISKTGDSSIASGSLMVCNLTIPVSANVMLDEACNQFFWKRTA